MKTPFIFLFFFFYLLVSIFSSEGFTFKLSQSTSNLQIWTTLPTIHVFKDDPVPSGTSDHVQVYLARNEYEPCQIVLNSAQSQTVNITLISIDNSSSSNLLQNEFFYVDYVPITAVTDDGIGARTGDTPDVIFPANFSTNFQLSQNQNFPLWIVFNASLNCTSGVYNYTLIVGSLQIPIKVHVFNFTVPQDLHFHTQMDPSFETVLASYSARSVSPQYWEVLERFKYWMIQHRITPKSVLWSGGLTSSGCPYISYNCTTKTWSDPNGVWGFEQPAKTYIKGQGFNSGHGFPDLEVMGLRNNDCSTEQRCSNLCSAQPLSTDWPIQDPTTAYNSMWLNYLVSMQNYLEGLNLLNASYVYLWNEPQNDGDYLAVACSTQAMQAKAPKLKKMVSEEPKPQIFSNPTCPNAKVDIWLPVFNNYNHTTSWERLKNYNEETWIYHLCHNNKPPYFNFVTLDHEPVEDMFVGLFHWKYRVRGLAYYVFNNWASNPYTSPQNSEGNGAQFLFYPPSKSNTNIAYGANGNRFVPSQRLEILRDSIELYEYFWLMNNGSLAQPYVSSYIDDLIAGKVILGEKSYLRDDNFIYNLRKYAGMYLGGEINYIPDIVPDCITARCSANATDYYINFQNASNPAVTVDNITYMKVDWSPYNKTLGYGWWGQPNERKYGTASSSDPRLQEILYDDYGRVHTFEFELPRGLYDVTVSVGWAGRTYKNNTISVNGVSFFLDNQTNSTVSYINTTKQVYCYVNRLFLEMGDALDYTMLNYMIIKINNTDIGFDYFNYVTNKTAIDDGSNVNNNSTNNNNGNSSGSSGLERLGENLVILLLIVIVGMILH